MKQHPRYTLIRLAKQADIITETYAVMVGYNVRVRDTTLTVDYRAQRMEKRQRSSYIRACWEAIPIEITQDKSLLIQWSKQGDCVVTVRKEK